jgi:hypothetical protein
VTATDHPNPRAWENTPTPAEVPDVGLLMLLAADAAARATHMLAGNSTSTSAPVVDAVRLLAAVPGPEHLTRTSTLTGIPADELPVLLNAYRRGGDAAVSATLHAAPCPGEQLTAAVEDVRACRTFSVGELTIEPGTITDHGAGVRVRLGPDGRWHPFTAARGQWWPADGANRSAGTAYHAAATTRKQRRQTT